MRRKIITLAVGVAVTAVVLFGTALTVVVWRLALAEERGELELAADQAAVVAALDRAEPGDPIELPRQDVDIQVAVYDPHGRRLAGKGPLHADSLTRAALAGQVVDDLAGANLRVAV